MEGYFPKTFCFLMEKGLSLGFEIRLNILIQTFWLVSVGDHYSYPTSIGVRFDLGYLNS